MPTGDLVLYTEPVVVNAVVQISGPCFISVTAGVMSKSLRNTAIAAFIVQAIVAYLLLHYGS
jgi:hypothetical protein